MNGRYESVTVKVVIIQNGVESSITLIKKRGRVGEGVLKFQVLMRTYYRCPLFKKRKLEMDSSYGMRRRNKYSVSYV